MASPFTDSGVSSPGIPPGASGVGGGTAASTDSARFERSAQLDLESFRPQLHSKFVVLQENATVELELREVLQLPGHQAGRQECFSLVFRGSPKTPLAQGLRWVQHVVLGEFNVFLVPIQSTVPDERWYEAVFVRQLAGGV